MGRLSADDQPKFRSCEEQQCIKEYGCTPSRPSNYFIIFLCFLKLFKYYLLYIVDCTVQWAVLEEYK